MNQLKELNNIYRRLDRRNEYKVLHKISWIQPALPDEETPYVHEIFDTHGLLIRLYQSRYLHLDLIGYMNGNLESNENEEQIELIKFTALQESIPEDVEQIDIPVSSDLLYLDLYQRKLRSQVSQNKEQAPRITEGMVEYILREDRRVFQNESHFLITQKWGSSYLFTILRYKKRSHPWCDLSCLLRQPAQAIDSNNVFSTPSLRVTSTMLQP